MQQRVESKPTTCLSFSSPLLASRCDLDAHTVRLRQECPIGTDVMTKEYSQFLLLLQEPGKRLVGRRVAAVFALGSRSGGGNGGGGELASVRSRGGRRVVERGFGYIRLRRRGTDRSRQPDIRSRYCNLPPRALSPLPARAAHE